MRFLLIGGKIEEDNYKIENFMLKGYDNPKILLFPTASKDSLKSVNNLKKLFSNIRCDYKFALLFSNDKSDISELLEWADILYFAGGNTKVLVDKIKEVGLDLYLRKTNKLIAGISAGAIMIARYGMGDSESYSDMGHTYNYKMVEGLGILDITICPHYENEDLWVYNDEVRKYDFDSYAIEGDTAIYYNNGDISIIKASPIRSVYKFIRGQDYKMKSLYEKKTITCLGPAGTFCDVACHRYLSINNLDCKIEYYPTITKASLALSNSDYAILPFENSLDGFVHESLDSIVANDFKIIDVISEDVEFAFVTNSKNIKDCKNVYAQFKAKGECLEFLTVKNDFNIIITDSNMASLEKLNNSDDTYGAIIPMHKLDSVNYKTVVPNVSDYPNNKTRFVVLSKNESVNINKDEINCSLCIFMLEDHPGILFNALRVFNEYGINLNSILSRPTKEGLGKYYFYIEIGATSKDIDNIDKCIKEISNNDKYIVKKLGIY